MKSKIITVFMLAAAVSGSGARAQTATLASAPAANLSPAVQSTPAPNQIIYAPRLPSAAELTNAAGAQGLAIDKIDQTNSQITVVYRYANGQTNTVAYLLLPTAETAPAPAVMPTTPPPAVVYAPPPRVIYYDQPAYYPSPYPWYWYPPVSVSLGFGFRGGSFHGGGFRGGFGGHWR